MYEKEKALAEPVRAQLRKFDGRRLEQPSNLMGVDQFIRVHEVSIGKWVDFQDSL
jgi:hypothetical protein